jgi:WD40 repeat protein
MMPVSALAVRDSRLVVASANGIVRLYDVHTLAPWMQINAASRFVSALALHPTRDCFAVAAEDGTLNVFSLPPVNHQVGPPSHPHTLTPSHSLHPTRDCFAVAAEDGTLNVFSLSPGGPAQQRRAGCETDDSGCARGDREWPLNEGCRTNGRGVWVALGAG